MAINGIKNPAVPFGSLVVVSGVSGLIGSHVADQALAAGYKVRGTSRSVSKNAWIVHHFQRKYGAESFELVEVPDMEAEGAFDEAARGATGFFHVAHDMNGSRDPQVAVSRAINGALNALKTAAKEPCMKRFVYTSSSFAATIPKPGKRFTVFANTFNNEAVEDALKSDPDGETVYAASKVEAERAILKWIDENKPLLIVNMSKHVLSGTWLRERPSNLSSFADLRCTVIVCPNANIGSLISSANQGYPTSAQWVKALWDSDYASVQNTPPQHFVNVQDDARLHVIALANPEVKGERIFPIAGPFNINDIISVMRKLYPQREWEDIPDNTRDLSVFEPSQRAEQLLKEAYGNSFTGLEESVKSNAADLCL